MADQSIKQEGYIENPECDYTGHVQYMKNIDMFNKCGKILYPVTKEIYKTIRNFCIDHVKNHPQYPKFNWKPKIVDVGCGGGFGSYILSHEADFVWGIDKSESSIKWAKEVYERHKNGIYYSPQLTFEVIDIKDEPRELMQFDIVACVEVIEHIDDYEATLNFLKRLVKKDKQNVTVEPPNSTKIFISSPNRNCKNVRDTQPANKQHVREWTPGELYEVLTKHFKYVVLMNVAGEPVDLDMKDPIMLFKCEVPIL